MKARSLPGVRMWKFQILSTIKQALAELGIEPWEVLMVSGIGQAGNAPLHKVPYLQRVAWKDSPCCHGCKAC